MLYLRTERRQDVFNVLPPASQEAEAEALPVLNDWISSLPSGGQR
jgi:hypothetical protein